MDKEIIIKGLENLKETIRTATQYTFASGNICAMNMARIDNAIALLKEQEAVVPRRDANCVRMFHCGACGGYVGFIDSDPSGSNEQDNYCRNCGRKVKWND